MTVLTDREIIFVIGDERAFEHFLRDIDRNEVVLHRRGAFLRTHKSEWRIVQTSHDMRGIRATSVVCLVHPDTPRYRRVIAEARTFYKIFVDHSAVSQ